MTVVDDLQVELTAATSRLLTTADALSDSDVTAPSLLPGWTRGHVLTHVARNADSHLNLINWAKTGVYTPQYPTVEAREAGIAEGAHRPIKDQRADLAGSAAGLEAAMGAMPPKAWSATVRGTKPPEHPAWYVLVRRLREVEVHHVDLDAGYTWADWPETFVWREIHDAIACWPYTESTISAIHADDRVWSGLGDGPVVAGTARFVLAWLTGRLSTGRRRSAEHGAGTTSQPAGRLPGVGANADGPRADERLRLVENLPAPPPWSATPAPAGLPATPPEEYP